MNNKISGATWPEMGIILEGIGFSFNKGTSDFGENVQKRNHFSFTKNNPSRRSSSKM
jgi:hypothetical protein